jgi:ADP-heptose:LPS heptosyltransferase
VKVLFAKWRALGDSVLLSAQVDDLKRYRPQIEVHLWIPEAHSGLFTRDSRVERVWSYRGWDWQQIRQLRSERFDAVFGFHAQSRLQWSLLLLGASVRGIHDHHLKRRNRFSTLTVAGKGEVWPATLRDAATWRCAFAGLVPPALRGGAMPAPCLVPLDQEPTSPVVPRLLLGWGASVQAKRWPAAYWLELIERVVKRWPKLRLTALVGENESVEELGPCLSQLEIWRGLGLEQLRQKIPNAVAFFGHDSGPKHLCAALGVRTLTLFGPQDPWEWHPYNTREHPYLQIEPLACRNSQEPGYPPWCGKHQCEAYSPEAHRCMRDLKPQRVFGALEQLIGLSPAAKFLT